MEHTEAGILSHKREYLRLVRQRQFLDICAAPYGVDYFFSFREAEIPAEVTINMLIAASVGVLVLFGLLLQSLGFLFGAFATLFLLVFSVVFLFNVGRMGMTKVDTALMRVPVFGPAYIAWFRKETYFQQDTRLVFLQSVDALVKKHIEETISEKGVRFLNGFEKQSFWGGLYKPWRLKLGGDDQPVDE